ncbi:MAG: DUF1570 domain-containing protein [Phycisphaerales bacterium]|nr:MAG: DUF1570 domain-containing protein [Phycisphaerales bacterium]
MSLLALAVASTLGLGVARALPGNEETADAQERTWQSFRTLKTDHFEIRYDTSEVVARTIADRAEATLAAALRFCESVGFEVKSLDARLHLWLFDQLADFTRYRNSVGLDEAPRAGFYSPEKNLTTLVNTMSLPEVVRITEWIRQAKIELKEASTSPPGEQGIRSEQDTLQKRTETLQRHRDAIVDRFNHLVLQHEVAHQVFFNFGLHVRGADNPQWLLEGLACQFEVSQGEEPRFPGNLNHLRLADLRGALKIDSGITACSDAVYEAALNSRRLASLADLISNPKTLTDSQQNARYRYAQAWGLVLYLSRKHRTSFADYLHRLSQRRPGELISRQREVDEFTAAFGPPDKQHDLVWLDYVLRLTRGRSEIVR